MIRRRLHRTEYEKDPFSAWNAFIDLIAMEDYRNLTDIQRRAHVIFWYESEVMNGGHAQYFANSSGEYAAHAIEALANLSRSYQVELLEKAFQAVSEYEDGEPDERDDQKLDELLEQLDKKFHECNGDLSLVLERYLEQHFDEFIELV